MKFFCQTFFVTGRWSRTFVIKTAVILVLLCSISSAWADSLVFSQVDFNLGGTKYTNTEWGSVDFTFTGQEPIMYFNLAVNETWQVQNIPVLSIEGVGVEQTMTCYFDLGTERGTDVNSLNYDYAFTSDILDTMPGGSISASVGDGKIAMWSGFGGEMPELAAAKPLVGGQAAEPIKHALPGPIINQECDPGECCPAAVSNSLQFLNREHKLGLDPNKLTIEEMKKATDWRPGGCPYNWVEHKKKYMEDNCSITTDTIDIDEIPAQIDKKQDVEITGNWAQDKLHTAMVWSITHLVNEDYIITVAHDVNQGHPDGTKIEPLTYRPSEGEFINGSMAGYRLEEIVVECPQPKASGPKPNNGANDIKQTPKLQWNRGYKAAKHDVYFSTNFNDVNDANRTNDPCGVLVSQNQESNYYEPGKLEPNTTYYWRIDEVNDLEPNSPWKGDVWSFTVGNHLTVDDFESYTGTDSNDPNIIYKAWKDGLGWDPCNPGNGTGSIIGLPHPPYVELYIVYGGRQSMPYFYDNSFDYGEGYYSEAEADTNKLEIGSDWDRDGVKALTLYFYGDPNNDANATERMYVALEDNVNAAVVYYDGNSNDVREPNWHEWNIKLTDFTSVDLNEVNKVYIGFGDRYNHPTPGGSGLVFFDELRLYPPRCVLSKHGTVADLTGDCAVDMADMEILSQEWLTAGMEADIYQDSIVNFRDFAVLASRWLEEFLWP